MKDFWSNFRRITFTNQNFFTVFLVWVICAFLGPFGTYEQIPLLGRAIYWGPLVALALLGSGLSCAIALQWLPCRNQTEHVLISSGVFVILFSPIMFVVASSGFIGNLPNPISLAHVLATAFAFACVLGVWGVLFGEQAVLFGEEPKERARLYARLPDVGLNTIVRITVQDHYVDVRLSDGCSHRLLMRFSDAVNEMDDADGFCVHRSHWVSRDAVAQAVKDGQKEFEILTSGERILISKTYRQNVVSAGFL